MADDSWTPTDVGKIAEQVQAAAYRAGYDEAKAQYVPVLMEHLRILADLRARAEALPPTVRRTEVIALFDGIDQ